LNGLFLQGKLVSLESKAPQGESPLRHIYGIKIPSRRGEGSEIVNATHKPENQNAPLPLHLEDKEVRVSVRPWAMASGDKGTNSGLSAVTVPELVNPPSQK